MDGISSVLASTALGALALTIWPFSGAQPVIELPDLVLLEPAPFEHRLDGDWRRDNRAADAPLAIVEINAPVEIMARPVSVGDYMACVDDGACLAPDGRADRNDLPVTGISWLDATAYAGWLSKRTGDHWRLPTDSEWAQAAGSLWRDDALGVEDDPNNPATRWLANYEAETARSRNRDREIRPVGSLNVNELGVYDIGGPVWEWTSTCLRRVHADTEGNVIRENETCGIYIAAGLHRAAISDFIRDPKSGGCSVGTPPDNLGFRLLREVAGV